MSNNKTDLSHLESVIDQTLSYLETLSPDSDEFAKVVDQLDKLNKMLPVKEPMFKPDTILGIVGNLTGIFAILGYEQGHVLTSKAMSFVVKPRI